MSEAPSMVSAFTEAERNEQLIRQLCGEVKVHLVEIGMLLAYNEDRKLWAEHHDSFKDFIEDLGIGEYSWVTRLVRMGRIVAQNLLTKDEFLEMGMSKATLLLPRIEKGGIDDETRLLASVCTVRDLREHLGHKLNDGDSDEHLTCPRCGADIEILPGMIRKG